MCGESDVHSTGSQRILTSSSIVEKCWWAVGFCFHQVYTFFYFSWFFMEAHVGPADAREQTKHHALCLIGRACNRVCLFAFSQVLLSECFQKHEIFVDLFVNAFCRNELQRHTAYLYFNFSNWCPFRQVMMLSRIFWTYWSILNYPNFKEQTNIEELWVHCSFYDRYVRYLTS